MPDEPFTALSHQAAGLGQRADNGNSTSPICDRGERGGDVLAEGTGRNLDVVRVSITDVSNRILSDFTALERQERGDGDANGREAPLVVERTVVTASAGAEDREGTAFALDPAAEGAG